MPRDDALEPLLTKAREQENSYEWLAAAESYEKALGSKPRTGVPVAAALERMAFCYRMGSRQTQSVEEFKRLRQLAVETYKEAAIIFEEEADLGRTLQCQAAAAYTGSWVAPTPAQRRDMLDECFKYGKQSLDEYKNAHDQLSYGRMCVNLARCLLERLDVAATWREVTEATKEGMNFITNAISVLSKLADNRELLRAYFTASLQSWNAANISEQRQTRQELVQKSLNYAEEALKLSTNVGNPYYTAMSNWAAAISTLLFTERVESSLKNAEEMLHQGTLVKDNYLKGVAYYVLAFVSNWMTLREADPDRKKDQNAKIAQYSEEAINHLKLVSQDFFIAEVYSYYAESFSSQAYDVEASQGEKIAALQKAVEKGRKGLDHAHRSGSANATGVILHALSKALTEYARLQNQRDERTRLLEEALTHRREYNAIVEKAYTFSSWVRGVGKAYEGLVEAELGRAEVDEARKQQLLEGAVSNLQDGVSSCRRWILSRPVPTLIAACAGYEDRYGGILTELYKLTKDGTLLEKSIEAYENAAKKFNQAKLSSRVAESHWKAARSLDTLTRYEKAAEAFDQAFSEYKLAAQNIPHFADFYLDYASYMRAWSELERAKFAHERENYAQAINHYQTTANLLEHSKSWGYLSPNFVAWSVRERAEDLSRKESSLESMEAFKQAADHFEDARKTFEQEIHSIAVLEERGMATELGKASARRRDYCLARASVEEARMHDQQGDFTESAAKYGSAASTFEKIMEATEKEGDRQELQSISYMCRAWEKMEIADGRDSPELYHEAADLFLQAKEYSVKNKTSLLASGNSALCMAFEFGVEFESSGNKESFSKAKRFLESAANLYSKAGFEKASLWASATEISLDAYNYIVSADTETDPEKKAKTYLLAEKCLERAAQLYERAGHTGRQDNALKTLQKIKEKSEFALSLGEVLAAPGDASTSSIFAGPGMTVEEPVGLMKFEHAFVEANLISHQKEVVVGGDFELEIQLANLGKNAAFLISLDELIPAGFDVMKKPEKCVVSNSLLLFKGRKLNPLETQVIRLNMKAKKKGEYSITPRVQYMDETGEHKLCQLEQTAVTVKELGIRGWLRGPG